MTTNSTANITRFSNMAGILFTCSPTVSEKKASSEGLLSLSTKDKSTTIAQNIFTKIQQYSPFSIISKWVNNLKNVSKAIVLKKIALVFLITGVFISVILPVIAATLWAGFFALAFLSNLGVLEPFLLLFITKSTIYSLEAGHALAMIFMSVLAVDLFPCGVLSSAMAIPFYFVGKYLETPQEKLAALEKK